ncbi:structural protein [Klebsiella variicola]|uniref:structural protein n=1 Tax=Klebsiella TaxID=570 RepID=UPI0020C92B1E|nr:MULTISPECIES: structural protein [Klebsiella]MCP9032521.1 structural protein [Klebsiella sp. SWET4]MDP1292944.1 structural protein [Klebsiella variicola]MDP1339860.1 structural protein [Klebsiella variicola]
MALSRGIRNNNPDNILRGEDWKGLVRDGQDTDKAFCRLIAPEYGIRAMVIILRRNRQKHNLNRISEIIRRRAHPDKNDTRACIDSVVQATGMPADQLADTGDSGFMTTLLKAIVRHENGEQPYGDDVFARALALAGDQ